MPVQKAGPDVRQNPIRFKNLIREAEERLDAMEIRHTEAVDFLKPAHELDTAEFWENQDHGLAILYLQKCFSTTVFRLNFKNWWLLAITPPQAVAVSDQQRRTIHSWL